MSGLDKARPSPLPLRRVRQHPHVAARDLQPAAPHRQRAAAAFRRVAQLAFPQLREQRRVTRSRTSRLSGVATSSRNVSAMTLHQRLQLLGVLQRLFEGPLHVEGPLGDAVVLAFHNLLEPPDGVRQLDVLARVSGELLGHVEGL